MPVDDYYSMLGVSADADREAIREAYRARRSELDDSETSSASAARLNRAWNVLSDETQRERYDDQLAAAKAEGDVVVPEIVFGGASTAAPKSRRDQARSRNQQARQPRELLPQETEINGVPLAPNRDRVWALVIDAFIAVLILLFGVQYATLAIAHSQKPAVMHDIDAVNKEITAQNKVIDAAGKAQSNAKSAYDKAKKANSSDLPTLESAKRAADAAKSAADQKLKDLNKRLTDDQAKLTPIFLACTVVGGILCMVIFAVPSGLTGRSPGKAALKLRLVAEDGTPATWRHVLVHYGSVIGFIVLVSFLGPFSQIGWIVAIFGVSSFARNPKRQGWHDRIAHTRVVVDAGQ